MSLDLRTSEDRTETASTSPFLDTVREPVEDPRPKAPAETSAQQSYRTGRILAHWESEGQDSPFLESRKLLVGTVTALIAIVAYAIYTDSPIMAITFILIGMTGYLLLSRPAESTEYMITEKGILVGREFYEYKAITSFWIIEGHPQFPKHLILDIAGVLTPRLHIPLEGNDSEILRQVMRKHAPEKEYEPTLVDIVERILHI
ncbi:MAG: hypothetical protein HGB18_05430 [Candidatus Moranbacteria bacterium]|nr:hypothetical protein [Candidatus Moranbacteria bacterium]